MDKLTQSQSVEEYLHERDQKLSSKNIQKYYRKQVEPNLNNHKGFVVLLIENNWVVTGLQELDNSSTEQVVDQIKKIAERPFIKAVVVLDVWDSENFIIDTDIENFAYSIQQQLSYIVPSGVLLKDYILASPEAFISLTDRGVL